MTYHLDCCDIVRSSKELVVLVKKNLELIYNICGRAWMLAEFGAKVRSRDPLTHRTFKKISAISKLNHDPTFSTATKATRGMYYPNG
jgi:hypothetical protein